MINLFIRSLILYGLLVLVMRIMGKRQIGELQPFELVISISIAELASIPLEDVSVPLLKGVIPIFTLVISHTLLTYFQVRSYRAGQIISGSPVILIDKGNICQKNMTNSHMSVDDLMEAIRKEGYLDCQSIEYAIIENDGSLSIFPKEKYSNCSLPIPLILEGEIIKENLVTYAKNFNELNNKLSQLSLTHKQIYYAYIDTNNELQIIASKTQDGQN